jgi:hypothetical protein
MSISRPAGKYNTFNFIFEYTSFKEFDPIEVVQHSKLMVNVSITGTKTTSVCRGNPYSFKINQSIFYLLFAYDLVERIFIT